MIGYSPNFAVEFDLQLDVGHDSKLTISTEHKHKDKARRGNKNRKAWAVVVARLVERPFLTHEVCSSNTVVGKLYQLSTAPKRRKETKMSPGKGTTKTDFLEFISTSYKPKD